MQKFGHIDVLVNNAAFAQFGRLEETTDQETRYQFEVNFFGLLNITLAVLPHPRQRQSGTIVNISSVSGLSGSVGVGLYNGSKFAVEGVSEALLQEMKPFHVRVHIVEPEYFRTKFLERQKEQGIHLSKHVDGYEKYTGQDMHKKQYGGPVKGVQRIYEVVTGTGMGVGLEGELRILLGHDAVPVVEPKIHMLQGTRDQTRAIALSTDL